MYQIKTINKISPSGLTRFAPGEFQYGDEIENPDAFIVRSASLHEVELPASLKAIARAGAGVNNIPVDKCSEEGIVVFNTPGANANGVKELLIAALILSSRNVLDAVAWAKTLKGQGADVPKLVEKGKKQFVGPEIAGKKLGVIGLGAIGVKVANAAHALGMEVYGYDPYLSVEAAWGISQGIHHAASLNVIYEQCDYITIHVPLTPETRGTFNAESIAAMKKGVRLFNLARGELAVPADIVEALKSGQVASYVVDFPCDELLDVPGVIPIPHLGASTPESEDNCAAMAADELIALLKTGAIRNSINFPNVDMPLSSPARVTVIHKNVPNMLSQITACFANAGINIDNIIDKSKKEMAYTIIDAADKKLDAVADALRAVDGVIRVRVI
ncbi:phosphoglycerate dehydrogenase [Ethanoligenens harbinense]|uniref:D-3-phosphoglycerate dehydrogenase n=1 Tax=Ethanoligenens harbinense (strain DSM 18485 / JCM 12961 / CGMCC 1.5033 / YUAN-3) TaxID=663278 RepID=E6U5F7_ETHHY|nr:phosphoglycerate dehydrogenase [Ethanoligenens harbinense]ADU25624.1 D-isomer specific 2-hydroxyacid dehydrogenase NAD-binding protein [Ethanoligenens harbinense YUAN-3]AVQ94801.1 3-phosphoglycerate dehydrogenase [Ethanoligenens harbinense YUAN-3]AYF37491.1 3-phosphoglycerate dehydrogenase [Ethanoligenens harbinense]AYF40211.1 3-phosphoglycerate dehydrogenase [Ethanoligenens harbinense]QCN91047.1 3-phosphoglycerate dehydrogenase [Ethanoligenens harbinense]